VPAETIFFLKILRGVGENVCWSGAGLLVADLTSTAPGTKRDKLLELCGNPLHATWLDDLNFDKGLWPATKPTRVRCNRLPSYLGVMGESPACWKCWRSA